MDARKFIEFFKTKTGNILIFGLLVTIGGTIAYGARAHHAAPPATPPLPPVEPDKEEPVRIEREGVPFVPPASFTAKGEERIALKPPPALPISLYETDAKENELSDNYAPYGRLIPCETVITIDSAKIETPIIGFVTEDVWHDGHLIIPAGAEVHGKAHTDPSRERIASENQWYIVWRTTDRLNGAELAVSGIALDMERDYSNNRWAITDGSAGLKGVILKTDNWAEIKLFAATFLSAAASGLEDTQDSYNTLTGGAVQTLTNSPQNAALQGTSAVLNQYAQQIADSIKKDGFYVRVPAGKQFYLYVTQTIDQDKALQGESALAQASQPSHSTPAPNP